MANNIALSMTCLFWTVLPINQRFCQKMLINSLNNVFNKIPFAHIFARPGLTTPFKDIRYSSQNGSLMLYVIKRFAGSQTLSDSSLLDNSKSNDTY